MAKSTQATGDYRQALFGNFNLKLAWQFYNVLEYITHKGTVLMDMLTAIDAVQSIMAEKEDMGEKKGESV